MKLLRIKITDPKGFRSLQAGFEYQFRSEWDLQEENGFAPFVCAGPNGSGKSNLLEALAAIFYHLECSYLQNRPDSFRYDEETNPNGFRREIATPDGFEIEYLFKLPDFLESKGQKGVVHLRIVKEIGESPKWFQKTKASSETFESIEYSPEIHRQLLPDHILGYSSGENEILSLPFFKMRFVQYDEYWEKLKEKYDYSGYPESRLIYLDNGFSQAILLCNLLFLNEDALKPFREDVAIKELKEFRIIIRKSIDILIDETKDSYHKYLKHKNQKIYLSLEKKEDDIYKNCRNENSSIYDETGYTSVYLINLLDGDEVSDKIIPRLKRCATCWYHDESSDTIYLDYFVNDATKQAFQNNFSNPIELFQAFRVLLTLNLYSVSDQLKADLYQSDSHYVSETVPTLASDDRIMRFKFVKFSKSDVAEPVMLKNLSDGEHQLLHALGLCLLFRNTQSLFLLDEPETHFNPDWRANFISRLNECFNDSEGQEMLITTHTPFLISDCKPEKVLVFNKSDGVVSVNHPDYNTLGASVNKITMTTFGKRETIGLRAQTMLDDLRQRFDEGENKEQLLAEINSQLGDSVEKVLLIKTIFETKGEKG